MTRNDSLALIGRILIAVVFIMSGLGKLAAPAATQAFIAYVGLPAPLLAYLVAVAIEAGGGVLLLVGYQTRPVSLVIAGFTVLTAVVFHHNFADQNQMIHFLKNIAMTGGLLQITAFGPGRFSIDARQGRNTVHAGAYAD